jgi:hypothetical protein
MADHYEDAQKTYVTGAGMRISQSFDQWSATPGVNVNVPLYTQNVYSSLTTGKASYSGPVNGVNQNYASQTYVLPNGKVSDWGGTIITPTPKPAASKSN